MKIFCWMQALEKDKADIMTLYQNEKEVSLQKADTDLYIKLVYETKLHGKCEISQSNLKVYSLGNNFLLNINYLFVFLMNVRSFYYERCKTIDPLKASDQSGTD